MTNRKHAAGFTLFELIMVIGICGILAAIGTSSFKYVTTANRVSSEINGLLGDMQFARSEALKRGQFVAVCPTDSAGVSCVSSNSWGSGWIVFVDVAPANNQAVYNSGTDAILRWQKSLNLLVPTNPDTLTGSASTLTYVRFNREGFADTGTATPSSWSTMTLDSATSNPNWRRCLAISATGGMTVIRGGMTAPTTC